MTHDMPRNASRTAPPGGPGSGAGSGRLPQAPATYRDGSDQTVRAAAFAWLAEQVELRGDVLPRDVLARGFDLGGRRVPLLGPQGIFKPAVMSAPLSITHVPSGPYDDSIDPNGVLRYRYRGTDPDHPDNAGLRAVMNGRLPLAYFHRIARGRYVAAWPVYITHDSPDALTFCVELDGAARAAELPGREVLDATRRYGMTLTRRRLHQHTFRERVLAAYRNRCALCRLRHAELLDAAHIVPDSEEGEPVVSNGLSLCRLHHAAFDRFFIGIRPDHVIEVRADVLAEKDGPTLRHAIQGLHGKGIVVPSRAPDRPNVVHLQRRYERFLRVAGGA